VFTEGLNRVVTLDRLKSHPTWIEEKMVHKTLLAALFLFFTSAASAAEWKYETSVDKMTDKETRLASLRSSNSLELRFPYQGENYGMIIVRQHPQHGLDVLITVDKGQIQCGVSDCEITVRVDDGKSTLAKVGRASSSASDIVFLKNPKPFASRLTKAKRVLVQLPMYQAGNQLLEFDAGKPLEMAAPEAPKKSAPRK
jgi:hypothetical protein